MYRLINHVSKNPYFVDLYPTASPFESTRNEERGNQDTKGVDPDPYPDILVVGFQELDLSTEALLYSANTTREDAWCLAVFAALGEKTVLYEKVQIRIPEAQRSKHY
jgi:hypothetical protein